MSETYIVLGHYDDTNEAVNGIRHLRKEGMQDLDYYSPIPCHELDDELYKGKARSPVRRFTLFGGILGCLGAFLMTSWMSVDYPIRVGAKPLLSFPAFVIIAFECTILLGAILTFLGMLANSRIPNLFNKVGARPEFTGDKFGLVTRVPREDVDNAMRILKHSGAVKVEVEYVH